MSIKVQTEELNERANRMAAEPGKWIVSEGYIRADISRETDLALKAIQEMIDAEAERLGLVVPIKATAANL